MSWFESAYDNPQKANRLYFKRLAFLFLGIVAQPTAGKFIKDHNLSGASSVKAALKVLEDKELVYRKPEGYVVYDRFMDLWLKRRL